MSFVSSVSNLNLKIDFKQLKENKNSTIDVKIDEFIQDRIASFIRNSPRSPKELEEYNISAQNFDLMALQRVMSSPRCRRDSMLKNSLDGLDICIKRGSYSQSLGHLFFLLREIEKTSDLKDISMRRLINAIIYCSKRPSNSSILTGLNDLIHGSTFEESREYNDFARNFKSWLMITMQEIQQSSRRGLYEVSFTSKRLITITDILNAFDESYDGIIQALKKFKSLNNSVENCRNRFENLMKKMGIEKTIQVYQYLIHKSKQSADQQYYVRPIVLGMIKACGAENYFRDFSFTLDPEQYSDIDFSFNFRLTESGMEQILFELKNKNPVFNELSAKVCISFDDLKNEVKRMVEEGREKQFLFVRTNIRGFHMSSVYLEKHSFLGYRAVILDSANKEMNYATGYIRKALPLDCALIVYYADVARQTDHTNCPVFCIRDFTQFAQASIEIIEHITNKDKSGASPADVNLLIHPDTQVNEEEMQKITAYSFTVLPARLMKLAQSLNAIIEYENKQKVSVKLKIHHIVEKWVENEELKDKKMMNAKISHFAWKYHISILKKCLLYKLS